MDKISTLERHGLYNIPFAFHSWHQALPGISSYFSWSTHSGVALVLGRVVTCISKCTLRIKTSVFCHFSLPFKMCIVLQLSHPNMNIKTRSTPGRMHDQTEWLAKYTIWF